MKIAETVKVRPKPDYVFDVDGQEFPWFISEHGPTITQVAESLYVIRVCIYCIDRLNIGDRLTFSVPSAYGAAPVIGDTEFPWLITDDGLQFIVGPKHLPRVTLSFFARSIEADGVPIFDQREIFSVEGDRVG